MPGSRALQLPELRATAGVCFASIHFRILPKMAGLKYHSRAQATLGTSSGNSSNEGWEKK